jgi:hypothetical protein
LSLNAPTASGVLFKYLERDAKDEAEHEAAYQICNMIGGLPLAIATSAGYITVSKQTLPEFVGHLKRSNKLWAAKDRVASVQDYDKTLGTVFDIALEELSGNARVLLDLLAFLNPDSIPEEMLLTNHRDDSLNFLSDKDE